MAIIGKIILWALGLLLAYSLLIAWSFYSISIRYYYEVSAVIGHQGQTYETRFVASCGKSLKRKAGEFYSYIKSYPVAVLQPNPRTIALLVPIIEPCTGKVKRNLKWKMLFGTDPIPLRAKDFAILLYDDTSGSEALFLPLDQSSETAAPETVAPVILDIRLKPTHQGAAVQQMQSPDYEAIELKERHFRTFIYREVPADWVPFLGDPFFKSTSGRYEFYALTGYRRDLPKGLPNELKSMSRISATELKFTPSHHFRALRIAHNDMADITTENMIHDNGPYNITAIEPISEGVTFLPDNIRWTYPIYFKGAPIPPDPSRPNASLNIPENYALFDTHKDVLLLPVSVSLRLNYLPQKTPAKVRLKALTNE